ncbi:MAG: hypothetical protein AAFP02_16010 [Bacteroidota bacterium]
MRKWIDRNRQRNGKMWCSPWSTGGDFLFLQPSLGLLLNQNLSWQVAIDLPVYTKVTGTQLGQFEQFQQHGTLHEGKPYWSLFMCN